MYGGERFDCLRAGRLRVLTYLEAFRHYGEGNAK